MMGHKSIETGDLVSVNINGAQITISHRAKVIYKPFATGDSWIFEDMDSGDVHYISEGCTVTKRYPKDED